MDVKSLPWVSDTGHSDNTTLTRFQHEYLPPPSEYNPWVVACMIILSAITVIGNSATIVIILLKSNLRHNPSNRFILSLSLADCFVGLFVMFPSALRIMVNVVISFRTDIYVELGISLSIKLSVCVTV